MAQPYGTCKGGTIHQRRQRVMPQALGLCHGADCCVLDELKPQIAPLLAALLMSREKKPLQLKPRGTPGTCTGTEGTAAAPSGGVAMLWPSIACVGGRQQRERGRASETGERKHLSHILVLNNLNSRIQNSPGLLPFFLFLMTFSKLVFWGHDLSPSADDARERGSRAASACPRL